MSWTGGVARDAGERPGPAADAAGTGASAAVPVPRGGQSSYALLADGGTVEIRAAGPEDAEAVRQMHAALSPDNLYLRFFSLSPHSAQREAQRVCRSPDGRHEALLAWLDGRLAGVASYEQVGDAGTAEIAFAVPDDLHHRGIGTLLLEHLVSLARQRGLTAFTATTLADNDAMLRVFADAGLPVPAQHGRRRRCNSTFPLPGDKSDLALDAYLDAVASRESRADVASLRHLLQPRSVAVIGAGRERSSVGRAILHNIVTGGFAGPVYAVNPHAHRLEGVPCVASVADLPEPPELAIIAVPAAAVAQRRGGLRDRGRPGPDRHYLRPGHRRRRPAGDLPPARHAAGRAELPGHHGARHRAQRDVHGSSGGPGRRGPRRAVRRSRDRAAGAVVAARYRGVIVRLDRRQV